MFAHEKQVSRLPYQRAGVYVMESRRTYVPFWRWIGCAVGIVIGLMALSDIGHAASVFWEAKLDINGKDLAVSVFPHVRITDVRCEVVLYDRSSRKLATRSIQFTDKETPDLLPDQLYVKKFPVNNGEVASVGGHLLYAKPILASPKAAGSSPVEELAKGVPSGMNRQ